MTTDIRQWLEALGVSQYADAFEANDIAPDLLPRLTDDVLRNIGVASAGHRLRILGAITNLAVPADGPKSPAKSERSSQGDGERRQATILVADISGYTALCGRFDAEQVQAILGRFYDVTDRVIANYGGQVIDHAGDATLASFGAPVAHGDDAARATRAALDIHAQAGAIVDPTGRALALHVGVASGEVVAATILAGAHPRYVVTGDAVNLAARLNAAAQAGQTLISDAVWRAVSRTFDAQPLDDVPIKGFDQPLALWRVTGLRSAGTERNAFVGRQTELRQLLGVLDGVLQDGTGLALCLRGDAGIGKSRLAEELRRLAGSRGFACHTALVLDFGVGKGQDAICAVVKSVLGVDTRGGEAALEAAVQAAAASGLIETSQLMLINDLLELPQSPEQRDAFEAMDHETRLQRTGELLVRILQQSTIQCPQLLVVEDIHWASAELLPYLALLTRAAAACRMVLMMTSRFDGDPLDKSWRASTHGSPLMTVDLGPLRPEESRVLAAGLLGSSNRLSLECIARAEGNPLFLEQLLRNAAESEVTNLPASIQSLVLARMDRLPQRDKVALQTASVIGKRFAIEALRALTEDPDLNCNELIASDLVRPEGADHVFAHALIQEGVYSSLLNARKRELHLRAADWFGEQEPILRAEHLDRASHPGAAGAYLVAAGAQARKFRHESALRLADRGIELAAEDFVRCALLLLRGDLLREAGRSSESIEAFQRSLTLAADESQRIRAWMGIVAGHRVTSNIPAAMDALDEAQRIAEQLGSAEQRSRIHHVRGNLYFARGDSVACRNEHESALRLARQAGDAECEAQALSGLGDAQYLLGRLATGLDWFLRCVALCERAGLVKVRIPNRCMVGHCLYYLNRMDESVAQIHLSLDEARRTGQTQSQIFALESLGLLLAGRGDYGAAQTAILSGIPIARAAGARRYLTMMLCALAQVKLQGGAREEARMLLDESLAIARQTGMAFAGPMIFSVIAASEQNRKPAEQALSQGESVLRETCMAHCHLHFYRNAIDVSLQHRSWGEALRYAASLEEYVSAEPLPWAELMVARARCLVAAGTGQHGDALRGELRRIRKEIERVGISSAIAGVDGALAAI